MHVSKNPASYIAFCDGTHSKKSIGLIEMWHQVIFIIELQLTHNGDHAKFTGRYTTRTTSYKAFASS